MRYLIIENNVIINIPQASEEYALAQGWVIAPEGVGIGWMRSGPDGPWHPGAAPVDVPDQILRWQAVRALRLHADPNAAQRSCLDTVNALASGIDDESLRADLEDALQSVIYWRRTSPTLAMIAEAVGWPSEFVDSLFVAAAEYDL